MIHYNTKVWVSHILALRKSDTIRVLWKQLLFIAFLSILISYIELRFFPNSKMLNHLPAVYSILGFVISLLLVFRTNTAYDRWWEGRKIWGQFLNDSRNLSIKLSIVQLSQDEKTFFSRMIPNFSFANKEHLRKGACLSLLDLTEKEREDFSKKNHIPVYIMQLITLRIKDIKNDLRISEEEYLAIVSNIDFFINGLGACERIKGTPIPYSYNIFIKKFIFLYVITLPLAFVNHFGYWAAFISTFVFFALVSMEVLAEEIEDPFGVDDNDLPTDEIAEKIKGNCKEIFEIN